MSENVECDLCAELMNPENKSVRYHICRECMGNHVQVGDRVE